MAQRSRIGTGTVAAAAVAAIGTALAVRAFCIEPTRPEITHHVLPIEDLPENWEGARVVHLSDLHYGNFRSEWLFRWTIEQTNALQPDLILITGDFVRRRYADSRRAAFHLRRLSSRHGVFAILGDHDFNMRAGYPHPYLIESLESAGIRLLRNTSATIDGLRVAGMDPITGLIQVGRLDYALADLSGESPHLLLAHSPDALPDADRYGVPMMLAGHTHGGQVVVPGYGPPITHTSVGPEHASGWSRYGRTRLYTSRGLASHFSLRFCCRPELVVFTLRRA